MVSMLVTPGNFTRLPAGASLLRLAALRLWLAAPRLWLAALRLWLAAPRLAAAAGARWLDEFTSQALQLRLESLHMRLQLAQALVAGSVANATDSDNDVIACTVIDLQCCRVLEGTEVSHKTHSTVKAEHITYHAAPLHDWTNMSILEPSRRPLQSPAGQTPAGQTPAGQKSAKFLLSEPLPLCCYGVAIHLMKKREETDSIEQALGLWAGLPELNDNEYVPPPAPRHGTHSLTRGQLLYGVPEWRTREVSEWSVRTG